MVTPSGCNNSSTPTCPGGVDSISLVWATAASTAATTQVIASPSQVYAGGLNGQAAIIAATAGSVAAAFCKNMTYGGYSDWYLPATSLANDTNGEFWNVLFVNSTSNGGPLAGFALVGYWSSTENGTTFARVVVFGLNSQSNTNKTGSAGLRCVRSYS